jgi:hypothetical protein
MKSHYLLPGFFLIGLTACGQQLNPADQALESLQSVSLTHESALGGQYEQLTADEIQQRREDWLSEDGRALKPASRAANAETPVRE